MSEVTASLSFRLTDENTTELIKKFATEAKSSSERKILVMVGSFWIRG